MSAASCAPNTAPTTLGTVLAGSSTVSAAPCTIVFGSSNDTAMLKLHQVDNDGTALGRTTDGSIDTTFGTSGVSTAHSVTADQFGEGGIGLQSTGRIIQLGTTATATNFYVVGYTPAGAQDNTFGTAGKTSIDGQGNGGDLAHAMTVLPNDKIVGAGRANGLVTDNSAIFQLTAAGLPDGTFGSSGVLNFDGSGTASDDQA
ncbi:MAG: hypothetical protein H7123_00945, partial [Thermoleophilia bacterium]|nr:hypothetical protein [Thermoleophilia bacterium]